VRLQVVTPLEIAVDADDVASLRAEDSTGSFGVLPHHADFVTDLALSVVTWKDLAGGEHRIAVRGGVLRVQDGAFVQIATRQAVGGETLEALGEAVLEKLREEAHAEAESRVSVGRMHVGLIRQLERYLQAGHGLVPQAGGAAPRHMAEGERASTEEAPR
jgi:F-type H+-transporting ATPase subunit epsilon